MSGKHAKRTTVRSMRRSDGTVGRWMIRLAASDAAIVIYADTFDEAIEAAQRFERWQAYTEPARWHVNAPRTGAPIVASSERFKAPIASLPINFQPPPRIIARPSSYSIPLDAPEIDVDDILVRAWRLLGLPDVD